MGAKEYGMEDACNFKSFGPNKWDLPGVSLNDYRWLTGWDESSTITCLLCLLQVVSSSYVWVFSICFGPTWRSSLRYRKRWWLGSFSWVPSFAFHSPGYFIQCTAIRRACPVSSQSKFQTRYGDKIFFNAAFPFPVKFTFFVFFLSLFRLDYSGIALLIMGSFVPWLYYSFYCNPQPCYIYLIIICVLGIAAIVVSQWDLFATPQYRGVRAGKRLVL